MEQTKSSDLVKKSMIALAGLFAVGALAAYSMKSSGSKSSAAGGESDEESKTEVTLTTENSARASSTRVTENTPVQMLPQGPASQLDSDAIELDTTGKHSEANLMRLLEHLSVNLKSVFLRNKMTVDSQLVQNDQLTDQQKMSVRYLFAEDMIKKQFVAKTEEVLRDQCVWCWPDRHSCSDKESITYPFFEKWIQQFSAVESVMQFMKLSEACGMNMMAPDETPSPSLDFSAELPKEMDPKKLVAIYNSMWGMQTNAGLKLVREQPKTPESQIHEHMETLFESHRIAAYERVMNQTLALKCDAQLNMIKAYLTFASSQTLAGYPEGGKAWLEEFNNAVKDHLVAQERALKGQGMQQ